MKWHYNEDGRNVCVMNDYSINGHLIPNSFVHISSETKVNDTLVIPCTCQIYNFMQNVEIDQESKISPDMSCMHCRFFNDHLLNAMNLSIKDMQTSHDHYRESSMEFMNGPVLLLGDILGTGTTKPLVKGNDYLALVTINFTLQEGSVTYSAILVFVLQSTSKKKNASISKTGWICQIMQPSWHMLHQYR